MRRLKMLKVPCNFVDGLILHQLQMNHSVWIPCRVLLMEPSHSSYQLRPREVVSEPSLAGSASGEWPKLGVSSLAIEKQTQHHQKHSVCLAYEIVMNFQSLKRAWLIHVTWGPWAFLVFKSNIVVLVNRFTQTHSCRAWSCDTHANSDWIRWLTLFLLSLGFQSSRLQ